MYGQSYVVTGGIDGSIMVLDVSHSSLAARSLQTLVAGRAVVKYKGNDPFPWTSLATPLLISSLSNFSFDTPPAKRRKLRAEREAQQKELQERAAMFGGSSSMLGGGGSSSSRSPSRASRVSKGKGNAVSWTAQLAEVSGEWWLW